MFKSKHKVQFPATNIYELGQDHVYFYLTEEGAKQKIRLHEYKRIFDRPGLYEQVVYERLKCQSPKTVVEILKQSVAQENQSLNELRVLDLGAGNGIVGEELAKEGVARLVGVDIIPEAQIATDRDRPGIYDSYHVMDLCNLGDDEQKELHSWSPNCLVSVAALGFNDIPPQAFLNAFNTISEKGWVAFNIKETFLDRNDDSGFSTLIRELIFSKFLDLYHLKRYRHRFSFEGKALYYLALGGKKNAHVPPEFINTLNLSS